MARRPFDPAEHGWTRTEYRQGDILDRASVEDLVAEADVVVHLAFIIFGDHEQAHRVNLEGSRNVFEATAAVGSRAARLHLVGRRLRLRRRRSRLAHRGDAGRGIGELLLLRPQGRARDAARPLARRLGDRRLRLPALDRRRRRRADAGHDADHRQPPHRGPGPAARGPRAGCRWSARCSPTPGCRSSSSTPTTSQRRSPPPSPARASPGSTTSRRPTRSPAPTSPASSAGRPSRCRSPRSRRSPRRSSGRR